jgi:pimeloyl-ACP methyl ester carboxylesterase
VSLAADYAALLAAHPPRRLTIDGERWELIEAGAGPPLVLLPGGFGVAATSFQYLRGLAPNFRVLALTYPPRLATIARLADGVAALLDRCGVAQAHVVGGSASGAVAQLLARRRPDLVATLILAQTRAPRPELASRAAWCAARCRATPPGLLLALLRAGVIGFLPGRGADRAFWRAHFAAVIAGSDRAAIAARFEALADYDRSCRFAPGDLAGWPGRVALIESARDGFVSARERAALRALYPGATLITLAGGHGGSVTDPAPQLAAIRRAMRDSEGLDG